MKRFLLVTVGVVGLLASQASVASAATIGTCGIGGCDVAGIIDLGVWEIPSGGESAEKELAFLNSDVIPAYNAANNPDLEPATLGTDNCTGTVTSECPTGFSDGALTITLTLGDYEYLKLKWDNRWQFYYTDSVVGDVVFNSTVLNQNGKAQALSHYTFFSPVPDGGATLLLLGAALGGLGLFGRRKK
jgi:hypothetical protein